MMGESTSTTITNTADNDTPLDSTPGADNSQFDTNGTAAASESPAVDASPLAGLLTVQGFVDTPEGRRLFPSTDSLRWFIRLHYRDLVQAGAIIKRGRRTMLCRPQIDHEIIRIAQDRARADLAY